MSTTPFRLSWPELPPLERHGGAWHTSIDGRSLRLSNLDKRFWDDEGITKGDVVAYYLSMADWVLPYVRDRPLTMKRMPDGADGDFFYEKQVPSHAPDWVHTAPVVEIESGARVDYVLASDRATLAWLANLGCIELHPWHSRVSSLGAPDYALFDLDPFDVAFEVVRDVALYVRAVLDRLGLRGYPRTSGATGMQVYVPIDPVHSYGDVRAWVGRVCSLINRADPKHTTMEWDVSKRSGRVFLDHNMNVEGKNIAATWSLRPEARAPVATPLRWEEVEAGVLPTDFTIANTLEHVRERAPLLAPILEGGQTLAEAMPAVGLPPPGPPKPRHTLADVATPTRAGDEEPGDLTRYAGMRDFSRTPEPAADSPEAGSGNRFVIQHHLATRLHHDLRLERGGTLRSWAVPKGLPLAKGIRHLAVQTEDHPLLYLEFSGDIPEGEYGAGPMRIWDAGEFDTLEWTSEKVTFRLHGRRHHGVWHLFRTRTSEDGQWLVTRADNPVEQPSMPPRYAPMLAVPANEPFDHPDWQFELKWDGVRAIATMVRPGSELASGTVLRSRRGNEVSVTYPELADLWERVLATSAVLDGEIVAFGPDGRPSFERLQTRMNLRDEAAAARAAARMPVTYMAFDLLAVDGEVLIDHPLSVRQERLTELLIPGRRVQRSEPLGSHGTTVFAAASEQGLEGIVGKRLGSPYRPGKRSDNWVKIKLRRTLDCVVGGWLPSESSHQDEPWSLLVGLWDGDVLRWVGRVGSGIDTAEREALRTEVSRLATDVCPFSEANDLDAPARWVRPELVCTVEFTEVTEKMRLRAPTYKGRRNDVDPRTCTITELLALQR